MNEVKMDKTYSDVVTNWWHLGLQVIFTFFYINLYNLVLVFTMYIETFLSIIWMILLCFQFDICERWTGKHG